MSEDQTGSSKPFDPLEPFRVMRDAYLDGMAKAMVEAVNTEAYAQATGAVLENSLTLSAPFREATEKSMLQVLAATLAAVSAGLHLRWPIDFTNLEMRLDDMDAKLDRIEKQTHAAASTVDQDRVGYRAGAFNSGEAKSTGSSSQGAGRRRSKAVKQAQPHKRTARKERR